MIPSFTPNTIFPYCFIFGDGAMPGCIGSRQSCVNRCGNFRNRFRKSDAVDFNAHTKVTVMKSPPVRSVSTDKEVGMVSRSERDISRRDVSVEPVGEGEVQVQDQNVLMDSSVRSDVSAPAVTVDVKVDHYLIKKGKLKHVLKGVVHRAIA